MAILRRRGVGWAGRCPDPVHARARGRGASPDAPLRARSACSPTPSIVGERFGGLVKSWTAIARLRARELKYDAARPEPGGASLSPCLELVRAGVGDAVAPVPSLSRAGASPGSPASMAGEPGGEVEVVRSRRSSQPYGAQAALSWLEQDLPTLKRNVIPLLQSQLPRLPTQRVPLLAAVGRDHHRGLERVVAHDPVAHRIGGAVRARCRRCRARSNGSPGCSHARTGRTRCSRSSRCRRPAAAATTTTRT